MPGWSRHCIFAMHASTSIAYFLSMHRPATVPRLLTPTAWHAVATTPPIATCKLRSLGCMQNVWAWLLHLTPAAAAAKLRRQHSQQQLHDFGLRNGALHKIASLKHVHQEGHEHVQAAGRYQVWLPAAYHKAQPRGHVADDIVGNNSESLPGCVCVLSGQSQQPCCLRCNSNNSQV